MPQGFSLTPGIFNTILKSLLQQSLALPENTFLIQYVDDLLIASHTIKACLQASIALFIYLGKIGFLVKKAKIQLVRPHVVFLGSLLSTRDIQLSVTQRQAILGHKTPITVKDMMAFLGHYSRHFIPDYTAQTALLRQLMKEKWLHNTQATLEWTPEATAAFDTIRNTATLHLTLFSRCC